MSELIVACLRIGERVLLDRVTTLRNKVARNLAVPYTMYCLTDQPERCSDVAFVDITAIGLRGWWNQMVVFEPMWRGRSKVIFLDLDVNIVGDIAPLAGVPGEFAITSQQDVARRYDPSVMVIGGGMGNFVWSAFERHRDLLVSMHVRSGPATCIAELYPSAQILQRLLPPDFFKSHLHLR
jgi:hypothetical protein